MPQSSHSYIAVSGLREALAKTSLLGPAGTKELKSRLKRFAEIAARDARGKVVVAPEAPHLRDTIRTAATRSGASVRAGGRQAPYAGVIEFGRRALVRAHMRGGTSVRSYVRKLHPQPFLFRSVDRVARTMESDISRAIQAVMNRHS